MLKKIKRQDCLNTFDKFPQCDNEKEIFIYPQVFKNHVLILPSKSLMIHGKHLGNGITEFANYFEFEKLIFLGDTNQYWLRQYNSYKPVKESYDYLVKNKINKRFNGGIEVRIDYLAEFVNRLFWLIRCNAAFPYVYFMDVNQTFLLNICKHGNIHLDVLNSRKSKKLDNFLRNSTFQILNDIVCYEPFSKSGAIAGRQTIV